MTGLRITRTYTVGDLAVTLVFLAAGVVFAVLAVRSVPWWWTTKFEFPPPMLTTIGLAGTAFFCFLVTRSRLLPLLYPDPGVPYVSSISGGTVAVWEGTVDDRPMLRRLGGRRSFMTPWSWNFEAPDEPALVRVLTALRDAGIGFAGNNPRDWTPSDDFIVLRERGLISGSFDEIGPAGKARRR